MSHISCPLSLAPALCPKSILSTLCAYQGVCSHTHLNSAGSAMSSIQSMARAFLEELHWEGGRYSQIAPMSGHSVCLTQNKHGEALIASSFGWTTGLLNWPFISHPHCKVQAFPDFHVFEPGALNWQISQVREYHGKFKPPILQTSTN